MPIAAVFLAFSALLGEGAAKVSSPPSDRARRIVAECERLVVARVGSIVEYVPLRDARSANEPSKIRIAVSGARRSNVRGSRRCRRSSERRRDQAPASPGSRR